MKHTQGPCVAVSRNEPIRGRVVCEVGAEGDNAWWDGWVVTTKTTEDKRGSPEADAKFIAAAFELVPELLGMLEKASAWIDETMGLLTGPHYPPYDEDVELAQKLHAIIAKAREEG